MAMLMEWIIERQVSDGAWEAVMTTQRLAMLGDQADADRIEDRLDILRRISRRSYESYAILSGLGEPDRNAWIAHDGLPADASAHARMEIGEASGLDYPGHFTLGDARKALEASHLLLIREPADAERLLDLLEALDEASSLTDMLSTVLRGPSVVLSGQELHYYPEMAAASNHEKLGLEARSRQLRAISDETVRFLIAYDTDAP